MKQNKLGLAAAALGMLVLIIDSRGAAQAASAGMKMCLYNVVPALFPFFLLSGYLTGNLSGGKWIARLFRCPDTSGTLLAAGLLGGYPLGARLAAQEYGAGRISKAQADRLLMFCSQAGPSFLFGIAASQIGSLYGAWLLWGIQLLSALSVAWLVPGDLSSGTCDVPTGKRTLPEAMNAALKAMASVCGWVILFSVVLDFLKRWLLWMLPEPMQILVCGILELTNGCMLLSRIGESDVRFLMASVFLNFGGLCVAMQTASVAKGLQLRRYMVGKILQTGFSMLYAWALMGHPVALLPLLCIIFGKKLMSSGNRGSIPAKIGV